MTDSQFDNFLALVRSLLRLTPQQREALGDELRDHLESRREELESEGRSRDDAIRIAVEEFGDTAALARAFASLTRHRTRRMLMRYSFASVIALTFAALAVYSLWPETPRGPRVASAVAQFGGGGGGNFGGQAPATGNSAKFFVGGTKSADPVQAKLDALTSVEFTDAPLVEILRHFKDEHNLNLLLDRKALAEQGFDPENPVVTIELSEVTFRTVLDLILEPLDLAHVVRDGVLHITTRERADQFMEVRVYEVSSLLGLPPRQAAGAQPPRGASNGSGGPAAGSGPGSVLSGANSLPAPGSPSLAANMLRPSGFGEQHDLRAHRLVEVVATTISPESWAEAGGNGTICEYGGLLVIGQTTPRHHEIEKLLRTMQESQAAGGRPEAGGESP